MQVLPVSSTLLVLFYHLSDYLHSRQYVAVASTDADLVSGIWYLVLVAASHFPIPSNLGLFTRLRVG